MQFLVFTASSSLTMSSVVHTASSEIRKRPEKVVAVLSRSLTKGGLLGDPGADSRSERKSKLGGGKWREEK